MFLRAAVPFLLLVLGTVPGTSPASAMEWLSGQELERSCGLFLEDPQSQDGALCLAFMQGFIAGSDASDAGQQPPAPAASSSAETYAERAARTRLGTLRMQRMRTAGSGEYCVAKDTSAVEVVKEITAYIEKHPEASDVTAYEAVREALVRSFPCDQ